MTGCRNYLYMMTFMSFKKRLRSAAKARLRLHLFLLIRRKLAIRTRSYLTISCLGNINHIPWRDFYRHGTDINLVNVISLTRASFEKLLTTFKRHYKTKSGKGRSGRPHRIVKKSTVLALLLQFYTAPLEKKTMCQLYAIPPTTLGRYLLLAEIALLAALYELPEARVQWPTLDEQREWGLLVAQKSHLVTGRWGFIDGKNYRVQKPTNVDLQNAMYNGWLHSVLITGVFCFGVDGTVAWGKHNFVGSWNDALIFFTITEICYCHFIFY